MRNIITFTVIAISLFATSCSKKRTWLEESGMKGVETPLGSMKIRNNAPKVIVDDLEKIDNKYILIKCLIYLLIVYH